MWNETDLDDQDHQFIPEHLVNHLPRQKENGEFGHVRPGSHGNLVESQHSHLLGVPSHDMLTDAMLGHIGIGERDREQVTKTHTLMLTNWRSFEGPRVTASCSHRATNLTPLPRSHFR